MEDLASQIWAGADPVQAALALAMMAVGGLIGAVLLWPAAARSLLPPHEETWLADFLPFAQVLSDGATLRQKTGDLAVCIAVPGVSVAAAGRGERRSLFIRRLQFVNELEGVTARVVTQRSRAPLPRDFDCSHPVRAEVLRRFHERFDWAARVRHVVVLTVRGQTEEARERLAKAGDQAVKLLAPFGARLMDHGETESVSEVLGFWAELVSPVMPRRVGRWRDRLAQRLVGPVTVDLDTGLITFSAGGGRERFAHAVVVPAWGDESSEELLPQLLSVDAEMSVIQRFRCLPSEEAELLVAKAKDWALATNPWSETVADQFHVARNLLVPGAENAQCLTAYELYVMVHGDTPEDARAAAEVVVERFVDILGARARIEDDLAQHLYFGQFPGYERPVRPSYLFAQNVAEFVTFPATPVGQGESPWGPGPLLILPTEAGTPYLFNFHEGGGREAPGHFLVIGGTGGGKTTAMTMAATGALRHRRCKVFAFDADRGMLVWTSFLGGRYVGLQSDLPGIVTASLQPLQLDMTPANKTHLRMFLRMLIGIEDDPDTEALIGRAIELAENLPLADRRLDVVVGAAFPGDSEAGRRLARWIDPAQYGGVFCGRAEHMPIADQDLVTFDMTSLLKDPLLAPPIVFDAMHRIDAAVTSAGCGALIMIDEAPQMLRDASFRRRTVERLRRDRKRGIAVGLLLQGAGDLDAIDPQLGTDVRKLTSTWIFLPNPKADAEEYKPWNLTDREMLFIKRQLRATAHMKFPALIKKPGVPESVFVDFDNTCLGDHASLFKSGEAYWRRAVDHLQVCGDPNLALEQYLTEFASR